MELWGEWRTETSNCRELVNCLKFAVEHLDCLLFLHWTARTVSEEWSSGGDSKTEDEERERRSPRDKDGKDKDKEDCEYKLNRL